MFVLAMHSSYYALTALLFNRLISSWYFIPGMGIFEQKNAMANNTSVFLEEYHNNFINSQIQNGRYATASDVVKAALHLFEQEENKEASLISELEQGEASGFVENFDGKVFLKNLHDKYVTHGL